MSEPIYTTVTAAIPKWEFKQSIVFVNPANPDEKMEFDSIEALNARLFEMRAEVERLRSQFANSEWRPIKTAPMDGTDILCFCVEPEFEGEENPWTEFRVCFYGVLTEGESCWMSHYGYEQRPTHWMPLPKPPSVTQ